MPVTDIGLMPAYSRPAFPAPTKTLTVATAKYGMILLDAATGNHDEAVISTSAGQVNVWGVVGDQGDPNNSDLFATGSQVTCVEDGYAEVLFPAGTVIVEGNTIITGATAGMGKVLAAEAVPYDVIGYAAQTITIGAAAGRASVRLRIHREEH